jgi:hypothetical protein
VTRRRNITVIFWSWSSIKSEAVDRAHLRTNHEGRGVDS